MTSSLSRAFELFCERIRARHPLDRGHDHETWTRTPSDVHEGVYRNRRPQLGIDFRVERLGFAAAEALDPRVVRIAGGATNERHKHAHETVFVVLAGEAELIVGDRHSVLGPGEVGFVPRWTMHQTRNHSAQTELVVLAITDFGLTSALLGDYDRRTRLWHRGEDAQPR